ncbi:MAG: hypothetical protein HN891_12910 [Planctomycetes bacterium]|jgi:hypothetical protein|nr:hypothetical protein [Planctomycetota bacterium]MBT6452497.1 hypothetical protein [Planctomycetota bacterium]MBT6541251.1 hypothetical protein [Planctomycetota bacterium]MBT6785673.1 hypothetical protein [Planctomycetota bacterium]MBT6969062.1 hypothetical protein [Planctomycetota bacterium]
MAFSHFHRFILLLTLMTTLMIGCRQVDKVLEGQGLPLVAWERDLYHSEGVLVYATSSRAAREIAEHADEAAAAFHELSGEDPRRLIYIAVDKDDSIDDQMLESGLQGISRISGKSVPEIKKKMLDSATQKSGKGFEVPALQALLGLIPGVLDAPSTRPLDVWGDALVIPTSSRISKNLDIVIEGAMEKEDVNTLQRVLWIPVIAIAKGYIRRVLADIREVIIIGVHARSRDGWPQERIDQMLKESLQEGEIKRLFKDGMHPQEEDSPGGNQQPPTTS